MGHVMILIKDVPLEKIPIILIWITLFPQQKLFEDPAANAHMTREEQIAFANSEKNLNLMDSAANQSKSDSTMSEWLDSERDGKKAAERFNVDEEAST